MKKRSSVVKRIGCLLTGVCILGGCAGKYGMEKETFSIGNHILEEAEILQKGEAIEPNTITGNCSEETITESEAAELKIVEKDWSDYFDGFSGTAVVYDTSARQFAVYNDTLAETRRPPCSTFKIISSLVALEHGILNPQNSIRKWSGEVFWNEKWNQDVDFFEAFHESCVWYFREVIDEIGQELMQKELDRLGYGNCDISDWEGRMNTNNSNRALTGFWLESSLAISPKEQTQVMERIFGETSVYSERTRDILRQAMITEQQNQTDICIYGKTGLGKAEGIVVDAWFTGFAEDTERTVYFCVYLGRTDDKNVSSVEAKEIAIRLVADYCNEDNHNVVR